MTIFVQQSSQQKTQTPASGSAGGSAGPMSIICTGPVMPSVIYHHHMYYLASSGPSSGQSCYIPCPPVSHSLALPNLMNSLVESVIHTPQGSVFAPRLSVPQISNGYSAPWVFEPSTVKVHPSFLNQIDAGVSLDRSKLKESSPKSSSASSSCSASSSSYFASLSSPNSSRLSPFSATSPSSPPSSPSSSPSSTASPVSAPDSSNSSKSDTDTKSGPNTTEQSRAPSSTHKKHKQPSFTSAGPAVQHAMLYNSSFTPSMLATPLLSGNASAFMPGAFFGTAAGSLSTQATGALCAPSSMQHTQQAQPPALPLRDYYARFGVYYIPAPWNQSYGMERVWMSEFRRIFSAFYNELWSIQPVERKPTGIKMHMFVDSAKVRFCCDKCGHSWTSMKGRIVFWFNLLSPNFNMGIAAIKLFGQKCESCKIDAYEQPMWYPEEVTKVLMNLFNRVGQIFYGFEKTKFEKQRRLGKPRTPHNKYLCQACLEGICLSRPGRRVCPAAIAGQQVPACPVEGMAKSGSESDSSQDEEQHSSTPDEKDKEDKSEEARGGPIRVEDEDEGHCSEDSGIVESDLERTGKDEASKPTANKVVPAPAKVVS